MRCFRNVANLSVIRSAQLLGRNCSPASVMPSIMIFGGVSFGVVIDATSVAACFNGLL